MSFIGRTRIEFFFRLSLYIIKGTTSVHSQRRNVTHVEYYIMKTIGLIGGMSWESSLHYYRIINEEVKLKLGGLHSAQCLLYSVDFEELERFMSLGEWNQIVGILCSAAKTLEQAGAGLIVLCTNTRHKVAPQIKDAIRIPFLHIADLTAKRIKQKNISKIGLLGTRYTMEEPFYASRVEANGIQVIIPGENDRDLIHRVIFDELCLGKVRDESRAQYNRIIAALVEQGAEGIILGCTEIGMLVRQDEVAVPLFDTTLIHAQEAVAFALK